MADNSYTDKMASQAGRLLVDISTSWRLAESNAVGILRTERELAKRLLTDSSLLSLPVICFEDKIYAVSRDHAMAVLSMPADNVRQLDKAEGINKTPHIQERGLFLHKIRTKARRLIGRLLRRTAIYALRFVPSRAHSDFLKVLQHGKRVVVLTMSGKEVADSAAAAPDSDNLAHSPMNDISNNLRRLVVHPTKSDIFWTCGLYSHCVPLRWLAEERTKHGFKIASICYDLIRVRHPEWNPRDMAADVFAANTVDLLDASDAIFCISDYVRDDLLKFANEIGRKVPMLSRIQLGADLQDNPDQPTTIARSKKRFALMVGTVEPRKNHELLLRVWERFSSDREFDLDLIIVGKQGYQAEANGSEIRSAVRRNKSIRWFEDASDAELMVFYQDACVLLCPSLNEGWGLPVTEALGIGCPVISSNRGALPEAGKGISILLDPMDDRSWEREIRRVALGELQRQKPIEIPTWDEAAKSLISALSSIMISSEEFHENPAA